MPRVILHSFPPLLSLVRGKSPSHRATCGLVCFMHGARDGEGRLVMKSICCAMWAMLLVADAAQAQDQRRVFAGALFGVSTLSADGRSVTMPPEAMLSLYKPENGVAVNAFAGVHLWRYFSVQGNYMWNRNDLTLVSSFTTATVGGFYEQQRRSAQHVFVADTLIYFRPLGNAIRPYLGTGFSVLHFTSRDIVRSVSSNFTAPVDDITGTTVGLRSHVGIDFALSSRLHFRYSFSETISRNPISRHLMPMGERRLANFQNLFGFVARF
jgi:opacity protein-like surface antigen